MIIKCLDAILFAISATSILIVFTFICVHITSCIIRSYCRAVLRIDEPDWELLTDFGFYGVLPTARIISWVGPFCMLFINKEEAFVFLALRIFILFFSRYIYRIFKNQLFYLSTLYIIHGIKTYMTKIPEVLKDKSPEFYLSVISDISNKGLKVISKDKTESGMLFGKLINLINKI